MQSCGGEGCPLGRGFARQDAGLERRELAETGNVLWPLTKKLIIILCLWDWAINLISTPHT